MHRFLLVAAIVAASACTSEPTTDTGQLVRIHDEILTGCHDDPTTGTTCSLQVTFTDGRFDARGLFDDGSEAKPVTGTVSEQAQLRLASLVSNIPLESPDTVHDVGCGGPPDQTRSADVNFVHDGLRQFTIEYASGGPMADFNRYLSDLVTGIRTCTSSDLAFDSCEPNIY
jgi:hypothetical protein